MTHIQKEVQVMFFWNKNFSGKFWLCPKNPSMNIFEYIIEMLDNSCFIALFLLIVFRIRTGSLWLFSNCFNHIFFSKFSLPFEEYSFFFIFILIFIFTLWYSYKNLHEARIRKSSFSFVHHTGWYNDNKTNIKTCTSEKK